MSSLQEYSEGAAAAVAHAKELYDNGSTSVQVFFDVSQYHY